MKHKTFKWVAVFSFLSIFFCGCQKERIVYVFDSTGNGQYPESPDNPSGNPSVMITAEEIMSDYIKVHFEPNEGVSYYKCGKGNNVSSNKYSTPKSIDYSNLNPNTQYSFLAIAYDSQNKELSRTTKSFKTKEAQYESYFRPNGIFYPIYSATMSRETLANGHYQKVLLFSGSSGYWFRIAYTTTSYPDRYWQDGSYSIGNNGYEAYYNTGSSIQTFSGGSMRILWSGNTMNAVIKDVSGMIVLNFVGNVQ